MTYSKFFKVKAEHVTLMSAHIKISTKSTVRKLPLRNNIPYNIVFLLSMNDICWVEAESQIWGG